MGSETGMVFNSYTTATRDLPDIYMPSPLGIYIRQIPCGHGISNLIKNSQAVKKGAAPKKGHGEKRCEIQGGGQEMAVMVG